MSFEEVWGTPQCCRNDRRGANFVGTLEWETSCSWWKNDFPAVSGIGAELRGLFRDETDLCRTSVVRQSQRHWRGQYSEVLFVGESE